jgi:chloramphenicol 3-O-phosphotransferase
MSLIILNGPTGAGKNTIAALVAKMRSHCAIVDFDALRNMFAKPHKAPWQGEEGVSQQLLGVRHACMLAQSFLKHKYDVILLDVLTPETAAIYKEELAAYSPKLILLLPTFAEIKRRNLTRPPRLTDAELEMVYQQQSKLGVYDHRIDNTHLSPEEAALEVNILMQV